MANPVYVLFSAQTTNADSATVYPMYGKELLCQFSKAGTFTTGTVTVSGRVDANHDWFAVATFDQATAAANMATLVRRFPEMKATLASISGAGATAKVALVEVEQMRP